MFKLVLIAAIAFWLPFSAQATNPAFIKQLQLDELVVYHIPVPFSQGFTTVMFPSEITSLIASGVSTDLQKSSQFLLLFKEGSHYFSIRARSENAVAVVNVVYEGITYVLRFAASPNPYYSVTFFRASSGVGQSQTETSMLTPAKLDQLCDKVKAYSILKVNDPASIADIEYDKPSKIIPYSGFRVLIDEIFRFNQEDTIFFRILLENGTDEPIDYVPEALAVRTKSHVYTQSFYEASGVMPPRSLTAAYFSITGEPNGRRANLSVKNDWNVLVPRKTPIEIINNPQDDAKLPRP